MCLSMIFSLLQLFIQALRHVKMPKTEVEAQTKFPLKDKPVVKSVLLDYCMDVLLLPYKWVKSEWLFLPQYVGGELKIEMYSKWHNFKFHFLILCIKHENVTIAAFFCWLFTILSFLNIFHWIFHSLQIDILANHSIDLKK